MLDSGQSDQLIQILHRIGFRLLLIGLCLLCLCLLPGLRSRYRNIILPVELHCSLHQRCLRAGKRIHLLLQSALCPSVRRRIRRFFLRVRSSCLRFPGWIRFIRLHSRPVQITIKILQKISRLSVRIYRSLLPFPVFSVVFLTKPKFHILLPLPHRHFCCLFHPSSVP